jgi:hypothetical protein
VGYRRCLLVAMLLGVFAVFGATGMRAKPAISISPIDKAVLVLGTENIIVKDVPIKPDVVLSTHDTFGILNGDGGILDCQFSGFAIRFDNCFTSYRTSEDREVSQQIRAPDAAAK